MTDRSDWLRVANEVLRRDLASLERMIETFPKILELDLATRAKQVRDQLQRVSDLYFRETWDSSEVITSSLDLTFSELEYETKEFSERVDQLDESLDELTRIYEQFIPSQALIMLVSLLEVYLSTVFTSCLTEKLPVSNRAISRISRYNFQNWGDSVDAFRTFFEIDLCPPGVEDSEIVALQQKRHVLVHQVGIIDERAARQLRLPSSRIGERLRIEHSEVIEGISLVSRISEHVSQTLILMKR